jgi:hypothetical protein
VNNTDGAGLAYNGSVGTDGDHTFTGSSGNTYYYRLYCSDAAGNSSSYTSWTDGILVDASAPSCSTASNSGNENTAVTLTASCSDTGGSGISSYAWYSNAACTTSAGSGSTLNAGTQTEPAAVTYYYKATDGAGNSSNCAVATSTWSNVAPTANNITGSANEGSAVTLTPNASDPGGTTMSYTWYSDSGCSSQITTGSTYNAPAQTDGTSITYYYKAFDAQGLGSTQCASAAATWNNVNPVVSALISPADGVWATSREFCATVTDTGGGTVTGKFVIGGSTYTGAAVSSGSNSCYTHTADLNGTSWYAYATDANSANSANSGTRAAYVDITAPTPSPSTGSAVSTCAYDGLSRSIDWTISASTDVTSGLHSSGYSFTNGATWQASNVLSESGQSLSELTKTVKARDVAGNQTTAGVITAGAVSCVAPPSSAPASPAGTLDGGQGLASLSWSTVSNASGYLIEESTDGGSTYLVIGDNTSNTLNTLTRSKYGQPCPKDYYYRVIAYTVDPSYDNDANCPAGYKTDRKCSAPSSVITAKIRYCTGLFLTE